MNFRNFTYILAVSFLGFLGEGCTTSGSEMNIKEDKTIINKNASYNTVFDGKIFSIPSPVQTAFLIKDLNLDFSSSMLNAPHKANHYTTEQSQALNLGVYGMDLGYTALHQEKRVALTYLKAIEIISDQLGLQSTFNKDFIIQFEKNSDQQDSIITLMSQGFTQVDNYLKSIGRKTTAAFVLVGGWTESLYLACQIEKTKPSKAIKNRIAEQKTSLETLIKLLAEYNENGANNELITQYESLATIFESVQLNYEYSPPETNKQKSLTILNHSTSIEMDEKTLDLISEKIKEIRFHITGIENDKNEI